MITHTLILNAQTQDRFATVCNKMVGKAIAVGGDYFENPSFLDSASYFGTICQVHADVAPFDEGDDVQVQQKKHKWVAGKIEQKNIDGSYDVTVGGKLSTAVPATNILDVLCDIDFTHMARSHSRQARSELGQQKQAPGWRHDHNIPLTDVDLALQKICNLSNPITFKDRDGDDIVFTLVSNDIQVRVNDERPELVSKLVVSKTEQNLHD